MKEANCPSRGGLTTKIHHAVDGDGRPLAVVVTPGQVHDAQVLPLLLGDIRVTRLGRGGPRTTPDALLADKAYSSKQVRADLAARGIRTVIPERADQAGQPQEKGLRRRTTPHSGHRDLQAQERRGTIFQPAQAVAGPGDPLRQTLDRLSLSSRAGGGHRMVTNLRDTAQ
ncbi:transposase [Streptomyces sp. CB01373]|uniref:transposase n=1 Tax=Streptomyces sp. CB01373 TaxID=2020325 RepID=UPI003FA361F2